MAPPATKNRSALADSFEEADFNDEVARCVLRTLGVRKAETVGDRVVRFIGLFLRSASEKDLDLLGQEKNEGDIETVTETPTSRLTFRLLSMLIPILSVKEKTVRFRATQIISHVINNLDSIDDELYHLIRQGLIRRIRDKEPNIRTQAVMGLGRLAGNEAMDEAGSYNSDDNADSSGLLDKLLDTLQHDTSAEVRRTLLLNLPLIATTLPCLLERARDLDSATRRALYARLLPTLGDFRHLSLSMREKLLRWGLRDRDENVRKAAGRLFYQRWIEDCAGNANEALEGVPVKTMAAPNIQGLLELLERIDIINSGVESGIALEAMRNFWQGRPDYIHAVVLDDSFWNELTPESIFMARSFHDFCHKDERYSGLCEAKMPEVTRLGFYLQQYMNLLLQSIKRSAELGGGEEETAEQEFIVEQLLHICLTLDYSDEIGRRKMFSLLRDALAVADLPEEVTKLVVDALRLVCGSDAASERDFCSVVLEAIAEVHDHIAATQTNEAEEDSFASAHSEISGQSASPRAKATQPPEEAEEQAIKEIMINMKCLHITHCMLQNVEGNLQENMHLVTMLNNLVVPAVRSHEAPIRERGLLALGLCCLLDRSLADENITLFIHCYSKGHEALQITALQVLSDIITSHPSLLSSNVTKSENNSPPNIPSYQNQILKCFTRALKPNVSPPAVQSTAATSISKLLLTSRLHVPESNLDDLLRHLAVTFFDPRTAENGALRQSLAYFFLVFAHSRIENCERMARVAVRVVGEVVKAADEYFTLEVEAEDSDGDIDETVADKRVKTLMNTVVGMLAEWTDGRKVVSLEAGRLIGGSSGGGVVAASDFSSRNGEVQMYLAAFILERVLTSSCHSQERKYLIALLGKLYVPSTAAPSPAPNSFASGTPSLTDLKLGSDSGSTAATPDEQKLQRATELKDLLDEAISEGVASDATGRNTLVKIKNSVLKYSQSVRDFITTTTTTTDGSHATTVNYDGSSVMYSATSDNTGSALRSGSRTRSLGALVIRGKNGSEEEEEEEEEKNNNNN